MKKMTNLFCLLMVYAVVMACAKSSSGNPVNTPVSSKDFRVLGYISSHGNWNTDMADLDFSKITDLNLAFVNPDSMGNFAVNPQLKDAVQTAHRHQVRIFFSIGGGGAPSYLANLIGVTKRDALIASLVDIAVKNNFDGVDVDIENDLITPDYNDFVSALSVALKAKNKLMTAALAFGTADRITDAVLEKYDFINIMSYDRTGPWTPNSPGPHAPLQVAKDDFIYFSQVRHVPAGKLLIGLPFYGYQFGAIVGSLNYKEIITLYPGSENADSIAATGGGEIYYNGMPTIKAKVDFALAQHAAGVMIWELHQDSNDSRSLLKLINAEKNK